MVLKASTRSERGVVIVELAGRITLGEASGTLRDTVNNALRRGHRKILLDLGKVSYIDSGGLGELVGCFATVSNHGAQLKLLGVQDKVRALMETTRLCTVFEAFEEEEAALDSFDRPAPAAIAR